MKKYEQEIRELLEKMDRESFVADATKTDRPPNENKYRTTGTVPPAPRPIRPKQSNPARVGKWMTDHKIYRSGIYMIVGFCLVIAGMVLRSEILRDNSSLFWLVQLIVAVGVLIFLAPTVLRFFTGRDVDAAPKTWRGDMVVNDEPIFTWQKVKGWFGGGKNNRRGGGGNTGRDPWNNRRNDRW